MTLGAPLGLLALLAVPALVAAYFLRRREPPRTVSALFLWRSLADRAEAGPRLERLSSELSLLVEVLAVLVAAAFLTQPRCAPPPETTHLVVVVDGSLSMRARGPTGRVVDQARVELAKLVAAEQVGSVTLVASGPSPKVLAGPKASVAHALRAFDAWLPSQPAHAFGPSLALAAELSGDSSSRLVLLTDGPLPDEETVAPRVEVRAFGAPSDNVALVSVTRREAEGRAVVTARVVNQSKTTKTVAVTLAPSEGPVVTEALALEPLGAGAVRGTFDARHSVTVSLPADALADDGTVVVLPAPARVVRVALDARLDPLTRGALQRGFMAHAGVELGEGPQALTVGPPGSDAFLTLGLTGAPKTFLSPFFIDQAHPLFDDAPATGVVWTGGVEPQPGRALLVAVQTPLVTEEGDGRLHLNVDVAKSNLPRVPFWPVLLGNVLQLRREALPGFTRPLVGLGEEVRVGLELDHRWTLVAPSGASRPLLSADRRALLTLDELGVWRLERDGEPFDVVTVAPFDEREADLSARGSFVRPAAVSQHAVTRTEAEAPWWVLVVLLLCLSVDVVLTSRPRPPQRAR